MPLCVFYNSAKYAWSESKKESKTADVHGLSVFNPKKKNAREKNERSLKRKAQVGNR